MKQLNDIIVGSSQFEIKDKIVPVYFEFDERNCIGLAKVNTVNEGQLKADMILLNDAYSKVFNHTPFTKIFRNSVSFISLSMHKWDGQTKTIEQQTCD